MEIELWVGASRHEMKEYHYLLAEITHRYPMFALALRCHQNTRGMPMSFQDRPYLVELYRDLPNIDSVDICKAVQTGLSELCIMLMLERAGWANRIAAYVLPTYTVRDRFVQNRINPLLLAVPEYKSRVGGDDRHDKGNLKIKRFGGGAMMFLGSNSAGDFVEFSADTLIIDEYDQCEPENLTKAKDRLRASPYPQMFRLGNPTITNTGISKLYDRSDRRLWYSKCDKCGHWQNVDWFAHVVRRGEDGAWHPRHMSNGVMLPVCEKCEKPIDRSKHTGCWVAESPSVPNRGYRISRLDILSEDLNSLYREWMEAQGDTGAMATFHASVLGKPYEYAGARLTVEDLTKAATERMMDYGGDEKYSEETITMGIDVGALLHCHISKVVERDGNVIRACIWAGAFREFNEIADAIRRYRVDVCVIDAMPETRKAKELRDTFYMDGTCAVWLCRFGSTAKVGTHQYGMKIDYRERVVQVDRTQVFDVSYDDIREGSRTFPQDIFMVMGWRDQMRAPVRILDEARQRIVWTEGSSADHYRLSDIYDRIAFDLGNSGGSYHG